MLKLCTRLLLVPTYTVLLAQYTNWDFGTSFQTYQSLVFYSSLLCNSSQSICLSSDCGRAHRRMVVSMRVHEASESLYFTAKVANSATYWIRGTCTMTILVAMSNKIRVFGQKEEVKHFRYAQVLLGPNDFGNIFSLLRASEPFQMHQHR